MADRSVKVTLSAQVQGYISGMENAARATQEVGSQAERLEKQREAFENIGRTGMVAGGAIAAGLGLAAKAAIDWDSAWAGVTKTVDGSPEQLAEVEQGLRGLAQVLPSSHTEIAAVAEAAGQLGIQTPNVVAFTKTMIDLGQSTNLGAEEAATQLARFMNVMGTAQEDVGRLGAALVDLGNNYATTESEILAMAQRLSGAGKQINMSEGQVLGLSTALSSVGIEAEAGGSAMSKVMIDIASSVDKGGDRLKLFADVAGMSAQDFAKKWKKDPGEALAAFVSGLANAEAQGKSTFGVLEELGITEVRMRDALLRSSAAADQFSEAMARGDKAMADGSALTDEANKRYETTASKIGIMTNKVTDAAITIGQAFLPAIEAGAEALGEFSDWLGGLEGPAGAVVAWTGAIAASVLLGGGAFLAAVPKVAAYKAALETLGTTAKRVDGVLSTIGKTAGIIGLVYAAVEAVNAFSDWSKEMSGAKVSADDLVKSLKETSNAAASVDQALKASSVSFGDAYDTQIAVDNLKSLNTWVGKAQAGFESNFFGKAMTTVNSLGLGGQLGRAKENIEELDQAMASLVGSGNTTAAETAFKQFAERAEEAGWSSEQIADALPKYAEAQKAAADAADEGAGQAKTAADAYQQQADAARSTVDELKKLIDTMNEANGVGQTAEEANARYLESIAGVEEYIRKANEGTEGYTLSLDASTAAGASNRAMLAGLAADSQASAKAIMEQEVSTVGADKATANYRDRLQKGREELIRLAGQLSTNKKEVDEFANKVAKVPDKKETEMIVQKAAATNAIEAYKATLGSIRDSITTTVTAMVNMVTNPLGAPKKADGGMVQYADGGVAEYANGGLNPGIYSGGTPIVKFAEPETRWEAFISGKPGKEARNREVWVEAGRRLGVDAGQTVNHYYDWQITLQSTGNTQSDIELIDRELRARRAQGGF